MEEENLQLMKRLEKLKKTHDAVILAHNYQWGEGQDAADFVGDSLDLSQIAVEVEAKTIVFCGVHFMAESASLLAPEKAVILPEMLADCPLANMITVEQLREARKEYADASVVTYINSSAAVKAESDICCTSSNALAVVNSLEQDRVLFVPDANLAYHVSRQTDKEIIPWKGYCITHYRVTSAEVNWARKMYPDSPIIVHPECPPEVTAEADGVLSTGGMVKYASEAKAKRIIVGTEMGMLHRLQKENPQKEFLLLSNGLVCPNMKYTTLAKVVDALEKKENIITVPEDIRYKAAKAVQLMLDVSN